MQRKGYNMLTIKDLFEKYGDVPLNEDVMKLFGINEPKEVDCMLRLKDVQKILRIKTASQNIKRLKYKYNLKYKEAIIPATVLAKEYGLETTAMLQYLKEEESIT